MIPDCRKTLRRWTWRLQNRFKSQRVATEDVQPAGCKGIRAFKNGPGGVGQDEFDKREHSDKVCTSLLKECSWSRLFWEQAAQFQMFMIWWRHDEEAVLSRDSLREWAAGMRLRQRQEQKTPLSFTPFMAVPRDSVTSSIQWYKGFTQYHHRQGTKAKSNLGSQI